MVSLNDVIAILLKPGLSLLTHASMPLTYWTYAFATAVYLINRMPTPTLHLSSPFEKLLESQPNYTKLRVFGCLCYPWLRPYSQHKLDSRSTPCIFLGYSSTQSAYICLDLSTSKIYISRHVKFLENSFPFATHQSHLARPTPEIISQWLPPVQILSISSGSLNTPPQRDSWCQHPVTKCPNDRPPLLTSRPSPSVHRPPFTRTQFG
ncbi:Integrase catalytic domain-containing protein [Abeliophyllum distichum]|uniref:Integrase catalytic domain-containing protein n=1 Tax=Abeliophyllum distichum TaxID=126358 RepID=A0ABD1TW03_9LAMI